MGFRPHTPEEKAELAHSISKMQGAAAPADVAPKAAAPESVNDQITDSVTVETPADESAQDAKTSGKNPFKKKP